MVNVHEVRHEYEKQSHVYVTNAYDVCNNFSSERPLNVFVVTVYACNDNFRRAALAEELAVLRQVDEFAVKGLSPPRGKNGFARYFFMNICFLSNSPPFLIYKFCFRASSLSPNARMARISSLENMLGISSNSLVAMASQLSEAEERERAFTNRGRWNQLRSMGEAKNLLQYMFNSLAEIRCLEFPSDTPPTLEKIDFSSN